MDQWKGSTLGMALRRSNTLGMHFWPVAFGGIFMGPASAGFAARFVL